MPIISQVGRNKLRARTLFLGIGVILWVGVLLHLFPVWWTFVTSISSYQEALKLPPSLFPRQPTLFPYKLLFSTVMEKGMEVEVGGKTVVLVPFFHFTSFYPIWVYLKNSFIMTGGIMVLQIPITALVAYSLSKLHSPRWSRILFLFFIGTMLVPYQISLVSKYLLLKNFPFVFRGTTLKGVNFLNTYWAIILPAMFSAFNCLLFKGFFDRIPDSIIQAARLDGASELEIFRRVVIPISKPVFAVVAYFTFIASWNDFIWPLIVLKDKLYPLSVFLYKVQGAAEMVAESPEMLEVSAGGWPLVMAGGIIQSIPVFIMFVVFREQIMKGIQLRGFK